MTRLTPYLILLGLGVFVRIPLWFCYQPAFTVDSAGYMDAARWFLSGTFAGFDGRRLPLYPLFLVCIHLQPGRAWVIQQFMGLAMTGMIYWLLATLIKPGRVAFLAAAFFAVSPQFMFFEAVIGTEILCSFLVLGAVAVMWYILAFKPSIRGCLLLGILSAFAMLVRPLFLFLGPMFGVLLCWPPLAATFRDRLVRITCVAGPVLLAALGWMLFNYSQHGNFTLSTNTWTGLVNHTGRFMEKTEGKYKPLADIYVSHRERLAEDIRRVGGSPTIVLAHVEPDILAQTVWNEDEYPQAFSRLSIQLILQHPIHYAQGVLLAWRNFWRVPLVYYPELWKCSLSAHVWRWLWIPFKVLWILAGLMTVLAQPYLWLIVYRDGYSERRFFLCSLSLLVLVTSVIQAMFEFGENARYAIPVQSIMLVLVMAFLSMSLEKVR